MSNDPYFPKTGELWTHYKNGDDYVIDTFCEDADGIINVLYIRDGDPTKRRFVRPIHEFMQTIDVDDRKVRRFVPTYGETPTPTSLKKTEGW